MPAASLEDDLRAYARGELTEVEILAHLDRLIAEDAERTPKLLDIVTKLDRQQGGLTAIRGILENRIRASIPRPNAPPAAGDDDETVFRAKPEIRTAGSGDLIKGRFRLEEQLGAGGMGKVFKALDLRRQEARDRDPYVAMKLLSEGFRRHPESFIALQREAKKAQSLAHPNIIRVYDFDRDDDLTYLIMEYLPGESLDRIIRRPGFSGLPLASVCEIVQQAGEALAFAHRSGIVHSDFKPSNVFLGDGEAIHVKVIDFGIARAVKRGDATEGDQTLFDAGQLKALSTNYASPEMIEEREPDPRDDIFALGCVTYELLTGRHPFNRKSAVVARDKNEKPLQPPGLSRGQWTALQGTLAFEREERTPSVERFLAGFVVPSGSARSRRGPATAGIAAVVGLLAVAGYWGWRQFSPSPEPVPETPAVSPAPETPTAQPSDERAFLPLSPAPTAEPPAPPPAPPSAAGTLPDAHVPSPEAQPAPTVTAGRPIVQPSDAEIAAVLRASAPCSKLTAADDDGTIRVRGYAASDADLVALGDQLRALPGVRTVETAITSFQAEKCLALDMLQPYLERNRTDRVGLSLTVPRGEPIFHAGEKLRITVGGANEPLYVYVDYFFVYKGALHVVHMLPRPGTSSARLAAGKTMRLGEGGKSGDWTVGEPFGTDLVTAIATPQPLALGAADEIPVPAAPYLQSLQDAIAKAGRQGSPAGAPVADALFVTTKR